MFYTNFREGVLRSDYGRFLGVGGAILLIVAGLTVGGYLLDGLFGTLPLFLLLGLILGFATALFYVYTQIKKMGGS